MLIQGLGGLGTLGGGLLTGGLGASHAAAVILGVAASRRGAAGSQAVGQVTAGVQAQQAAGGVGQPAKRARRKQKMHVWQPLHELLPVEITAKAASARAAGKAQGRAKWLLVIEGKAASSALAPQAQGTAGVIDVELQEFMVMALAMAA